jgi:hypothetical protein
MQSNNVRIAMAVVSVAVAVVLLFVFKDNGGSSDSTTTTGAAPGKASIPTIVVKNGKPVGGIRELDYAQGDQVRFKVVSDVSDEVHVHGYDIAKDVKAGGSVSFDFTADIEGVFEAELESRKEQIIELRVNP